jgi:hypothetical protein
MADTMTATGGWGSERTWRRAVEGNEIGIDEGVAGLQIVIEVKEEHGANGIIAVEADPGAVGGQDQKHVEHQCIGRRALRKLLEEAVRQKAETLPGNLSDQP